MSGLGVGGTFLLVFALIAGGFLLLHQLFLKHLKFVRDLRKPAEAKRQKREQDNAEIERIKKEHSIPPPRRPLSRQGSVNKHRTPA